jgi:hypothetical protein
MLTSHDWIVLILVPALSVLFGAMVSFGLASRQLSIGQRNLFLEKQLSELYSPLAGLRKRIRALSEYRVKVHAATGAVWHEVVSSYGQNQIMHDHDERFKPYQKTLDYTNEQLERI